MKFRKKQYVRRSRHVTDWGGCGNRNQYIESVVRSGLNVDGSKPGEKKGADEYDV